MELPYFISIHTRVASFALHTRHHLQHWRRLEGVARSAGLAPHGGLGALPRAPRFGLAAAVLQMFTELGSIGSHAWHVRCEFCKATHADTVTECDRVLH